MLLRMTIKSKGFGTMRFQNKKYQDNLMAIS